MNGIVCLYHLQMSNYHQDNMRYAILLA